MKKPLLLSVFALFILSCNNQNPVKNESQNVVKIPLFPTIQFQEIFDNNDVKGAFLLYDLNNDTTLVFNEPRTNKAYIPASTFKIINSMIALETEVIKDEEEIIKWDGQKRFANTWNKDHNLRSGIKHSVVWFYQELARRIGEDRMQYYIDTVGYGNQNIAGEIDQFWLIGDIRITMKEQIEFLKRLYKNELPFSQRTLDIVKDIMILEQTETYILRAKTGWAGRAEPNIGWFVGYLEHGSAVYFFATNIDIRKEGDADARKKITMEAFEKLNLFK